MLGGISGGRDDVEHGARPRQRSARACARRPDPPSARRRLRTDASSAVAPIVITSSTAATVPRLHFGPGAAARRKRAPRTLATRFPVAARPGAPCPSGAARGGASAGHPIRRATRRRSEAWLKPRSQAGRRQRSTGTSKVGADGPMQPSASRSNPANAPSGQRPAWNLKRCQGGRPRIGIVGGGDRRRTAAQASRTRPQPPDTWRSRSQPAQTAARQQSYRYDDAQPLADQPYEHTAHWLGTGIIGSERQHRLNILARHARPAAPARRRARARRRRGRRGTAPGAPARPPWLHREVARRMAERLPLVRRQPG